MISPLLNRWLPRFKGVQVDRLRLHAHRPEVREAARDELDERRWAAARHDRVLCGRCHEEIDPDTCGCGMPIEGHALYDNHSPIPMGCDCYRAKEGARDAEVPW